MNSGPIGRPHGTAPGAGQTGSLSWPGTRAAYCGDPVRWRATGRSLWVARRSGGGLRGAGGVRVEFEALAELQRRHPAWRLLSADNAPLILSFLGTVFVDENARSVSATDLAGRLDDVLYALNEAEDAPGSGRAARRFPRKPADYLNAWAAPEAGWLRKFYPEGSDEPHYDATPAVEKALAWVRTLQERSFVGTESRLSTVFQLLQEMVVGAETDPRVRLAELEARRLEIDERIERVRAGEVDVLDDAALRDRYQQVASTARELLGDFREVEENFRRLDRELRAKISLWSGSKGELLDQVLGSRESISESDQGRSFQAFYSFLLSQARQEELTRLLEAVQNLGAITAPDPRLRRIHHDWLGAGERTQATVRRLSEQLRQFLDSRVWFENRRVMDLIQGIEKSALELRDQDVDFTAEIDATTPDILLPMERPLYTPLDKAPLEGGVVLPGQAEVDDSVLFEQVYVDSARLVEIVRRTLRHRAQVGLADVIGAEPLTQGLAELVAYLSLTDAAFNVVFDPERMEQVTWRDSSGSRRIATLPTVTYVRATATATATADKRSRRVEGVGA